VGRGTRLVPEGGGLKGMLSIVVVLLFTGCTLDAWLKEPITEEDEVGSGQADENGRVLRTYVVPVWVNRTGLTGACLQRDSFSYEWGGEKVTVHWTEVHVWSDPPKYQPNTPSSANDSEETYANMMRHHMAREAWRVNETAAPNDFRLNESGILSVLPDAETVSVSARYDESVVVREMRTANHVWEHEERHRTWWLVDYANEVVVRGMSEAVACP